MAITFKPSGGETFTFGGTETAPPKGVAGPYPNVSINRTRRTQDSLFLGNLWEITITGTALITTSASHLTKGARQAAIFTLQKKLMFILEGKQGLLDIDAYGGTTNMQFKNTKIISVNFPDQDDASMGTQNMPYTITAQSYDGDHTGEYKPERGKGSSDIYWIESFDETWDISGSDAYSTTNGTTAYKTYTISRTLSAQAAAIQDESAKMHYQRAKAFVEDRLIDGNPLTQATLLVDERNQALDLSVSLTDYVAYNQVRTRNQAIAAGSYSVTDSWTATRYPATHTVDFSINQDPTAEYNTVDVSVNVQGMDSTHPETSNTHDKYTNATLSFATVKSAITNAAVNFYNTFTTGFTLRTTPRSESETHNELDGTISYTVTYDDAVINFPNAVSESLNVTYDNIDGNNQTIVIIPVLEKADGPVIQDMATTPERRVSVSLDLQMNRQTRTSKPDAAYLVAGYIPANSYQQQKTETWSPTNGSYSLSMEWVYVEFDATVGA
jgi:hypothetical protein